MITTPSEYRFVDFTAGDLPTDRFDGGIMPLRTGISETTEVENFKILRAEDVAFLHECVADKLGAFEGTTSPESWHTFPAGPRLTPTRKLSSVQMIGIRSRLDDALTRGIPNVISPSWDLGVGFLARPFEELKKQMPGSGGYPDGGDGMRYSEFISYLDENYFGHWTSSTYESDFAVGAPFDPAKIALLFTDAQKLVTPVLTDVYYYNLGHNDLTYVKYSGTASTPYNPGFPCWCMSNSRNQTTTPATYTGITGFWVPARTLTLFTIPDTFLSDIEVWLVCTAYDGKWAHGLSRSYVQTYEQTINLTSGRFVTTTHQNGQFVVTMSQSQCLNLLTKNRDDNGFQYIHVGNSTYADQRCGFCAPSYGYFGAFYVVGTPNDRTKWTTPSIP